MWYLGLSLSRRRRLTTDWQLVVEKVERFLEGWPTKVMSKWVKKIMGPRDDLAISVLQDNYGSWLCGVLPKGHGAPGHAAVLNT